MNDNIKDMRRLLPLLLLFLSLTACPAGFAPSGVSGAAGGGGAPSAILGGGGDIAAAGGDVPGGATAGSPGGDLRPKADPEIVYPIRLGGGTAVTITEFRMFNGATLTHLVDPNTAMTLPMVDDNPLTLTLRLLVQAGTGPDQGSQWFGDMTGYVRLIFAPKGVSSNNDTFCDVPVSVATDGSNVNVSNLTVEAGSLLLYYRNAPSPAGQWVDCASPVSFASIGATAYQDFISQVNPIEFLGFYRANSVNPIPPPPAPPGGTGTGGLPPHNLE